MLPLDDSRWAELHSAHKTPCDASLALRRFERGEEIWEELHHQGDVGEASYAAVRHLVRIAKDFPKRDWNLYSLVSTIEIERRRKTNPRLPGWLTGSYREALTDLLTLAVEDLRQTEDSLTVRSILGAVALAKGCLKLGAIISHSDESEIDEILETYDAWSEYYS